MAIVVKLELNQCSLQDLLNALFSYVDAVESKYFLMDQLFVDGKENSH